MRREKAIIKQLEGVVQTRLHVCMPFVVISSTQYEVRTLLDAELRAGVEAVVSYTVYTTVLPAPHLRVGVRLGVRMRETDVWLGHSTRDGVSWGQLSHSAAEWAMGTAMGKGG